MMLWALSRGDDLGLAWRFLERMEMLDVVPGGFALAGLLSACEQRKDIDGELKVFEHLARCGSGLLCTAVSRVAASRLAESGRTSEAFRLSKWEAVPSAVSAGSSARSSGAGAGSPLVTRAFVGEYEKETQLLEYVFANAQGEDPGSVCDAIEAFGRKNLSRPYGGAGGRARHEGQWLKVAGGDKAEVLAMAVRLAPGSGQRILEVGTYCGYSTLRLLAAAGPDARVVTFEADPGAVMVARNIVEFAGLAHAVDVRTGHSEDTLPELARVVGSTSFDVVFFDQRGSRYTADLMVLEKAGLLSFGSVVVADNVLKPGAPAFLWHVLHSGLYETRIVRVQEYAMPGVEDWMSVSIYRPPGNREKTAAPEYPLLPYELRRLEWEADQIRAQAECRPGINFRQWGDFAARMKQGLAEVGIAP